VTSDPLDFPLALYRDRNILFGLGSVIVFGKSPVKHNAINNWPFDQPRNCTTLTMRQVLNSSEPILLVSHDADDHGWQFIGSSDASVEDGRVVCLEEIVTLDRTVLEVADLPPGWQATREHVGGEWTRRQRPPDLEDES